jgi:hypothetical protein
MIHPEEKIRGALSEIHTAGGRLLLRDVFVSESCSQICRRDGLMHSRTVSESLPLSEAMLWAQGCR